MEPAKLVPAQLVAMAEAEFQMVVESELGPVVDNLVDMGSWVVNRVEQSVELASLVAPGIVELEEVVAPLDKLVVVEVVVALERAVAQE